ncbi:MAG: helix-turn-helix domain-containing protein [Patescibacteria group bacterium]
MQKELEDLGLSEKEAKVYLAALEVGRATADQLAKQSKIVRSTTYVQLESLMKMGLISTYKEGKKTYFAPESPELLRRLLQKQKDAVQAKERDLASLLPDLLRQFEGAGERPVVRFFPGKEGVTVTREESLLTKEKKILSIFSYDHLRQLYSEEELDAYSTKRKSLGIHSQGIHLHKAYFEKAGLDALTERRFISPDQLPLTIDVAIFDNKTVLRSLRGTLFGIVIESDHIADNMKTIFHFLWNHAASPKD